MSETEDQRVPDGYKWWKEWDEPVKHGWTYQHKEPVHDHELVTDLQYVDDYASTSTDDRRQYDRRKK